MISIEGCWICRRSFTLRFHPFLPCESLWLGHYQTRVWSLLGLAHDSLTQPCCMDLIDVTLAVEGANSHICHCWGTGDASETDEFSDLERGLFEHEIEENKKSEIEGGGKGRLELFRKFICFSGTCPWCWSWAKNWQEDIYSWKLVNILPEFVIICSKIVPRLLWQFCEKQSTFGCVLQCR